MQSGALASYAEMYDPMDIPTGFGASRWSVKHGTHAQNNVMGFIKAIELQGFT